MEIIKTKKLTEHQYSQINQMWNEEYPIKLKDRFPLLLEGVKNYNHFKIEDAKNNVMAWAVDFEKDNEIRFSIIVNSLFKAKGLGSLLMDRLKLENRLLFGWVIDHNNDLKSNGTVYQTPMSFYLKHGFEILKEIRIETELIHAVKIKWASNEK